MKRFLPLFFAYFAKKIAEKFASSEKSRTFASLSKNKAFLKKFGKVVEWSITAVLKTAVLRGTGGSNPSLSAERTKRVCQNTLLITEDRYIAELSYEVVI